MSKRSTKKRTLGWMTKDGRQVQVCDMSDEHLLNSIAFLRRDVMLLKLRTGVTNLSFLALCYLEEEAESRGLEHETSDPL
jgi:hypothetical protein